MSDDNLLRLACVLDRNSWDTTCRRQDSGAVEPNRERSPWHRRGWAALRKELQRMTIPGSMLSCRRQTSR